MGEVSHIGIDFGTTNTAVIQIYIDELGQKTRILGEKGNYPFSSIVAIPKNGETEILFGRNVKERQLELSKTHYILQSLKSYLGTNKEFYFENQCFNATDITIKFLQYIKNYIKEYYSVDITTATFSIPVDFTYNARKELKIASIKAGITPKNFISESTSAYISNVKNHSLKKVMVLDWGGGTLDISILNVTNNKLTEEIVWGEQIGGNDIDLELAKLVHNEIISKSDTQIPFDQMPLNMQDNLICLCENAKIDFSYYDDDYPLTVNKYGIYGTKTLDISYNIYKDVTKKIILKRVLPNIKIALNRANITKEDIDSVIIVGGSSNIRPFATAITNYFGIEKVIIPENLQWSVSIGAGLFNIIDTTIKLNTTIGLLMSDNTLYPILKKGEATTGTRIEELTFILTDDTQEAIFIFVDEFGNPYATEYIQTKGFYEENLILNAEITQEQIAKITIKSNAISSNYLKEIEINKLAFYYDIAKL